MKVLVSVCFLVLATLVVGKVSLTVDTKAAEKAHETSEYRNQNVENKYGALPLLVLRRGRPLEFVFTKDGVGAARDWLSQVVVKVDTKVAAVAVGDKGKLTVTIPADAPTGRRTIQLAHTDNTWKAKVIILFDPFKAGDSGGLYNNDANLRKAHAANDWGISAQGSYNSYTTSVRQFEFYKFLPFILDVMEGKIASIAKLADDEWDKPLEVARYWHKTVRSNDDTCEAKEKDGLLSGCWDRAEIKKAGTTNWPRMTDIIDLFIKKQKAVKWGQCFVFGSMLSTMCRGMGILTRSISTFESCSPVDDGCGAVPNTNPWNFHVWNEFFIGNEWLQMDGTFAKDVSKLSDILNNNHVDNARYVADEVKALRWNQLTKFKPNVHCKKSYYDAHKDHFDKNKCGKLVVTQHKKAPGSFFWSYTVEDRTEAYKGESDQDTFQPKLTFIEVKEQFAMRRRSQSKLLSATKAPSQLSPSGSGGSQATLEIIISPAKPKLGDSIVLTAMRNDKSFYLDVALKVKIFLVSTDYTKQPFAVAFSKVMDAHLKDSDDASKATVTLAPSDYLPTFAMSPYFQVIYVYYNADGSEPQDEHVLRHYETPSYEKGSKEPKTSSTPSKGTGNEIEFFIEAALRIAQPPVIIVPAAGQKDDVLKKLAADVRKAAPDTAPLQAFYEQMGVTQGIVDVNPGTKAKLLVLLPNPVQVPFTHVTLDIYAPGVDAERVVVKSQVDGGDTLIFPLEVALDQKIRGHDWPQFVTVVARAAELCGTTGQVALAVTGEAPTSESTLVTLESS